MDEWISLSYYQFPYSVENERIIPSLASRLSLCLKLLLAVSRIKILFVIDKKID